MFETHNRLWEGRGIVASEAQQLSAEQQQRDVFETHRHRVFSVSYYMTANEAEAETILTSTFQSAFAAAPRPSGESVDRCLLEELERRFSLAPSEAARPDAEAHLTRGNVRRTDLEEAVGTLPPQERLLFLLRDVEGYAPDRIARLLGCEELEVHRGLLSARIRMRNLLARQHRSQPPVLHDRPAPAATATAV